MKLAKSAMVLSCVLVLPACSLKYHADRGFPTKIPAFSLRDACELVVEEENSRRPSYRQKRDLAGEILTCTKREGPYAAGQPAAVHVERHLDLFKFIEEKLPRAWFSKDPVPQNTPELPDEHLKPHVDVTTRSPLVAPEAPAFFVTRLSDRGQKAVVETFRWSAEKGDNRTTELKGLIETLRDAGNKPRQGNAFSRQQTISLLVSTAFNSNTPADRLEKVYIFLLMPDSTTVIDVEKVVLETLPGLVNLGTEKTSAELSPSLSLENFLPEEFKSKLGLGTSKIGRTLEKNLTKRFALRNVSVNADRRILFVRQEGQEGIDVSGNLLSSVGVELPNRPASLSVFSLVTKQDKENEEEEKEKAENAENAKGTSRPSIVKPRAAQKSAARAQGRAQPIASGPRYFLKREWEAFQDNGDANASVVWVALARVVGSGGDTISEEDDSVTPRVYKGHFRTNLWKNDKQVFAILASHKVAGKCYVVPLSFLDTTTKKANIVAFDDYRSAIQFYEYVSSLAGSTYWKSTPTRYLQLPATAAGQSYDIGFPVRSDNGEEDRSIVNFELPVDGKSLPVDMSKLIVAMAEPSDFPLLTEPLRKEVPCAP